MRPGQPLPDSIFNEDAAALEAGFDNLKWHLNNVAKYGVPAIVAINRFPQDSEDELNTLALLVQAHFPNVKVAISDAFSQGGNGAVELANAVVSVCETDAQFSPLYSLEQTLEEKVMAITEVGYGAGQVKI